MKVGLILANELRFSPYVDGYMSALKECNTDFEIIEFNRKEDIFKTDENPIIGCKMPSNKYKKLLPYLKWKKRVIKLIKIKKYDKVIVFTSMVAVMLSSFLLRRYKNNFIFDKFNSFSAFSAKNSNNLDKSNLFANFSSYA